MKQSDTLDLIAPALIECQQQVLKAKRNATRELYRYADLESVWKACRKQLAANDLVVLQHGSPTGGLETVLMHKSGQWVSFHSHIAVSPLAEIDDKIDALTRQRRVGLMGVLGILQEPDKKVTPKTAKAVIERNRQKVTHESSLDPHELAKFYHGDSNAK